MPKTFREPVDKNFVVDGVEGSTKVQRAKLKGHLCVFVLISSFLVYWLSVRD